MNTLSISNLSLKGIPYNQVYVILDFWRNRIQTTKTNTLPAIWKQLKATGRWDVLKLNWREGMPNRPHHFWDSDIAKWTEATCYALTPYAKSLEGIVSDLSDEKEIDLFLTSKVADVVDMVSKAQWEDGYINSYFTVVEPGKRWTNVAWNHEMYCAGHLLEAAIAHNDYVRSNNASRMMSSGDPDELALLWPLIRYVKHINRIFGTEENQRHGYPGHQELELALMKLHDHLSQPSFNNSGLDKIRDEALSLASFFVRERGTTRNGMHFYDYEAKLRKNDPPATPGPSYPGAPRWTYNQASGPIDHAHSVEGHSVRAGYWLTGVCHVARVTHDALLTGSSKRLWQSMSERKMHITGGIGAIGDWEGFGPDYYYPNETAYLETCAAISLIFFAHQMHFLEPFEPKHYSVLERALYNGALVRLSLDGKKFFYDNPLATVGKSVERKEWFEVACCPPNIARLLASMSKYIYSYGSSNDTKEYLFINLLIPSRAVFQTRGGNEIFINQERNGNNFTFQITGETPAMGNHFTTVFVRIPDWANLEDVDFDCQHCTYALSPNPRIAGFIVSGTVPTIYMHLTIRPRLIYPDPNDSVNRDCVAVQYGPHIYCVETVDNEEVADLRHIRIPRNATTNLNFAQTHKKIEGIELECLRCQTYIDDHESTDEDGDAYGGDWVVLPQLKDLRPIEVELIPYFAWANRGPSDVRVWLRLIDVYDDY